MKDMRTAKQLEMLKLVTDVEVLPVVFCAYKTLTNLGKKKTEQNNITRSNIVPSYMK